MSIFGSDLAGLKRFLVIVKVVRILICWIGSGRGLWSDRFCWSEDGLFPESGEGHVALVVVRVKRIGSFSLGRGFLM